MASIPLPHDDVALAERLTDARSSIVAELRKLIVGQDAVIEQALIALFAGGHSLIVGVPGLAKTLLVHTLAQALDLRFSRIQFTPDLMPTDITGTDIIQEDPATGQRRLAFTPGPVFANVLLADEINRTPPKTQAALLEAMQERQVTVGGKRRPLPAPFFVLATQNPIEQEGTYPLPEAQLDRFMVQLTVGYPTREEEEQIVAETTTDEDVEVTPVRYARMTISARSGVHWRTIMQFGSGTAMTWFGATWRVSSNQNCASWFSTWPLNGMVPMTRSNALRRSVTTMTRRPAASM